MTVTRAEDRRELLRRIDAAAARHAPTAAGMDAKYRRAFDLVTSPTTKEAFDLSREPE